MYHGIVNPGSDLEFETKLFFIEYPINFAPMCCNYSMQAFCGSEKNAAHMARILSDITTNLREAFLFT